MNQEFIIENAERVAFRDMSEADQHAILEAKLNTPESVEIYIGVSFEACIGNLLSFNYIYRVRAIATPLNIPWEVINPKYNYAAILDDLQTLVLSPDDLVLEPENWRSASISFDVCYTTAFNIPTTGIDWRRSKTRRPV